jgi:hypothetical protein
VPNFRKKRFKSRSNNKLPFTIKIVLKNHVRLAPQRSPFTMNFAIKEQHRGELGSDFLIIKEIGSIHILSVTS